MDVLIAPNRAAEIFENLLETVALQAVHEILRVQQTSRQVTLSCAHRGQNKFIQTLKIVRHVPPKADPHTVAIQRRYIQCLSGLLGILVFKNQQHDLLKSRVAFVTDAIQTEKGFHNRVKGALHTTEEYEVLGRTHVRQKQALCRELSLKNLAAVAFKVNYTLFTEEATENGPKSAVASTALFALC